MNIKRNILLVLHINKKIVHLKNQTQRIMKNATDYLIEDLNKDFDTTLNEGLEITEYNYNYNKFCGYEVDVMFNYNDGSLENLYITLDGGGLPTPIALHEAIEKACIEFCSHLKENEDTDEAREETNNSLTHNFD